jgi:hypothetical protein
MFAGIESPIKDDSPYSASGAWLREKGKPTSLSTGVSVALTSSGPILTFASLLSGRLYEC